MTVSVEVSSMSTRSCGFKKKMGALSLDDLPKDLLVEILVRLPSALAVNRCKPVSKNWYSLLSDPNFISRYIKHQVNHYAREYHKPCSIIITCKNRTDEQSLLVPAFKSRGFSLNFLPEKRASVKTVGSFNDLLLCCVTKPDFSAKTLYICNSFTRQWIDLPLFVRKHRGPIDYGFICQSFYSYSCSGGQGEKNSINCEYRYRVLCFTEVRVGCFMVETYSSETGTWNESVLYGKQYKIFSTNIVAHNGMLHWFNGVDVVAYDPFNHGKTCFIDGSEFKRTADHLNSYCLGVCQGFLRIMKLVNMGSGEDHILGTMNSLSIWELKDNGKWNLEHSIPFNSIISKNLRLQKLVRSPLVIAQTLAFNSTNKNIVYLDFDKPVSYNLQQRELKLALKVPKGVYINAPHYVFPILLPWWPTPVAKNNIAHL